MDINWKAHWCCGNLLANQFQGIVVTYSINLKHALQEQPLRTCRVVRYPAAYYPGSLRAGNLLPFAVYLVYQAAFAHADLADQTDYAAATLAKPLQDFTKHADLVITPYQRGAQSLDTL